MDMPAFPDKKTLKDPAKVCKSHVEDNRIFVESNGSFEIANLQAVAIKQITVGDKTFPNAMQICINGVWMFIGAMETAAVSLLMPLLPKDCKVADERS